MPDVTTPTPQGAPTPTPAAPPAPPTPQPPAAPPAPVPTPPANPPTPQPTPPADGEPLNLTKERFNEIITTRLNEAKTSWEQAAATAQAERNAALAAALGITDPNATPDPAEMLKQAQQQATAAQQRADTAEAKALALAAGVKPERLDLFMRLADVSGVLKDVDRSKPEAATAALKSAVDGALTAAPEFKGTALPGASGGDGQGGATPGLNERIAAAEQKGDWKTAITLKRQKAREQAGG